MIVEVIKNDTLYKIEREKYVFFSQNIKRFPCILRNRIHGEKRVYYTSNIFESGSIFFHDQWYENHVCNINISESIGK